MAGFQFVKKIIKQPDKTMTSTARTVVTAKETFQILMEVSKLLNTGLDETTLAICVRLCESGANPEALAKVITELQRVKREETGKGQGDGGQ